jgi:ubiquinone/menaquinone biosynthesis C-methylase UbiE
MAHAHDFLPAAGHKWLLPFYDPFVALFSRERKWRGATLDALDLKASDTLVDIGCGTGTLAIMAKERVPTAKVIGVDPDADALARSKRKASRKGSDVTFLQGFGNDTAKLVGHGRATKAVSSMAFHHMPREMQQTSLASIRDALAAGGRLVIADFVGGGHFGSRPEAELTEDLTASGFRNVRILSRFRVAFADAALVSAEKL